MIWLTNSARRVGSVQNAGTLGSRSAQHEFFRGARIQFLGLRALPATFPPDRKEKGRPQNAGSLNILKIA
jgi:hypothetical protein